MKHKPLDGCRAYPVPIDYGEDFELVKDENGEVFLVEDVKDAVHGLLEEIELTDLEWVVYDDGRQERMSEKERKQILKDFIKKWLKDVFGEDDE